MHARAINEKKSMNFKEERRDSKNDVIIMLNIKEKFKIINLLKVTSLVLQIENAFISEDSIYSQFFLVIVREAT